MKFSPLLWALSALTISSCTTLSNRRDLYAPSENAGPYNSLKPHATAPAATQHEEPLPPAQ